MNATTIERERERQDFALRAAEAFATRGVLVIRISEDEEPTRYDDLVRGEVREVPA